MTLDLTTLLLLSGAAFIAGLVDSIAGGGGLIALPSLLLAGLDPVSALATNKLQGTFGTASATYTFWKKGLLKISDHIREVVTVFIGASLGVMAIAYAPTEFLRAAMPIALVLVAIYFALSPKLSNENTKARLPLFAFSFALAPLIGFYDGIFGPGTGSFFMLALISLFGFGVLQATAQTKLYNFTSNIASLLIFILAGHIVWIAGLCMGVAQFAGAQIGSRLAIANGTRMIRPLLVLVCIAMAARLLFS
jgi:uncharacterized protein